MDLFCIVDERSEGARTNTPRVVSELGWRRGVADLRRVALRDVAEARTMTALAKDARLNRESLYRTLSPNGNPRLKSLTAVLAAFGLKLRVEAR